MMFQAFAENGEPDIIPIVLALSNGFTSYVTTIEEYSVSANIVHKYSYSYTACFCATVASLRFMVDIFTLKFS